MSRHVGGADGGGTNTRVVILDEHGREAARSVGGGGVVTGGNAAEVADRVAAGVSTAAAEASLPLPLDALWAGLAGVGREPARSRVQGALLATGVARTVEVGTDVEAALTSGLGDAAGLLLLAGTGSIAVGRREDGSEIRVGGWGHRLGDEGSGYWIGLEGLRAVVRAVDGRGEATEMGEAVRSRLGIGDAAELIDWLDEASKAEVGALAPLVCDAASSGDSVAGRIVEEAVTALAGHVAVVLERAGPWDHRPSLALWGGLVVPGGPLRERLVDALGSSDLDISEADVDPALGAAEQALRLLRQAVD